MKKILIVSTGYMWFPCETGPSRFYYIADYLVNAGYAVDIVTVDFQHFKKEPRDTENILAQGYPFNITFIKTPPYKKNIGLGRIKSNSVVAGRVAKHLEGCVKDYDAVYVTIPSNNVAAKVTEICRENAVPCVVDVEDLWPEAMSMVLKNDGLRNTLLFKLLKDAETAYANASGVIGTSDDYTDRAFKKRERDIPAKTVYVGVRLKTFDEGVEHHRESIVKPEGEIWVTYAGSLATSYDIKTLIDSSKQLEDMGRKEIKIHILGTGPMEEEFKAYAGDKGVSNVLFHGYKKYPEMAAFLVSSDMTINSFVKGAPQSIVNKIGDYLASGKPMVNTLENPIFTELVDRYGFGINVPAADSESLANAIVKLSNDCDLREEMGRKARKTAEEEFDTDITYGRIVDMIESVISGG